jgi:hypothetical protein
MPLPNEEATPPVTKIYLVSPQLYIFNYNNRYFQRCKNTKSFFIIEQLAKNIVLLFFLIS